MDLSELYNGNGIPKPWNFIEPTRCFRRILLVFLVERLLKLYLIKVSKFFWKNEMAPVIKLNDETPRSFRKTAGDRCRTDGFL